MGSASCLKNTSVSAELQAKVGAQTLKSKIHANRPKFYPCATCGRKFTARALEVHKKSCSESPNCSCTVCISSPSCSRLFTKKDKKGSDPVRNQALDSSILENEKMKLALIDKNGKTDGLPSNSKIFSSFVANHLQQNTLCTEEFLNIRSFMPKTEKFLMLPEKNSYILKLEVPHENLPSDVPHISKNSGVTQYILMYPNSSKNLANINGDDINCISLTNQPCSLVTGTLIDNKVQIKKNSAFIFSGTGEEENISKSILLCKICNQEFSRDVFGSHVIQHAKNNNSKHLDCPVCYMKFCKPARLLIHFHKHITDSPFYCKSCGTSFKSCESLRKHTTDVHGYIENQPYHCYICLGRFTHSQTIINHMRLHSKETPFKCNECNRAFSQIGNLQRHLSVHRGERPHKCFQCEKSFADPATLRNHVRIHTGETPFVCHICSRAFTQVGNLKRHMARHYQTRPKNIPASNNIKNINKLQALKNASIQSPSDVLSLVNESKIVSAISKSENTWVSEHCENENMSDSTKSVNDSVLSFSQVKDKNKDHKWQLFPCSVCGRVYTWQHDLTIHFRIHTGEKPYKCDICDKRFAQSGAVRIHKARHHFTSVTSS